jgi:hypothetical protein
LSRTAGPNGLFAFRICNQAFALGFFAGELAHAADRFGFFTSRSFRGLFVEAPLFHFAKDAFPLHLLLEDAKRLIDVVVANQNLQVCLPVIEKLEPTSALGSGAARNPVLRRSGYFLTPTISAQACATVLFGSALPSKVAQPPLAM